MVLTFQLNALPIQSNILCKHFDFFFINIQGDESEKVNIVDGQMIRKDDSGSTETESESESEDSFNVAVHSPVSGSVNYFVAPLDSSDTQAMVIEELNQVRPKSSIQELR